MIRWIMTVLALGALATSLQAADKPLWLVVTTPQLAPSIQSLAERRRSEGLDAVVFVGEPKAALAKHPRPTYLLLVGDAPGPDETPDPAWHVPAIDMPLYRWRDVQRKTYASDAKWGELDGDDLPDAAVGRIPARTPAEVSKVVAKILAYEGRPWTIDDLRFPIWLGAPGHGAAVDAFAAMMTMTVAKTSVPRWGEPSMIAALQGSSFCGWPAEHAATFNRWLRRGGMCALVGAHGDETFFFSMDTGDGWSGYQGADVERELAQGPPTCPLIVLSCLTGNFAAGERCLTESLLLAPGGPVAVAGATTESHGLTNALHGLAMARGYDAAPERLGDFWLAGLRASYAERNLLLETLLPNIEGALEPNIDVAQLRRDQVWMYALLGDPATRIRAPRKLSATIERVGDKWRWHVEPPPGADKLEVAFRPTWTSPPTVPGEIDPEAARKLQEKANAIFAYKPTASLSASDQWQGDVDQPGEVRLVAMAPDRWYLAVLKAEK